MKLIVPDHRDSLKKQLVYLMHLVVRIILWAVVLHAVLWIYDAVSSNRYASRIYVNRAEQYDIVAFGDSLVEGVGSEDLVGFVGRLEQQLGIPIYNAGNRGDQTKDLLLRIESDVAVYNPKIVIVVIGGNDAVRLTSEEEVLGNLEQLFARLTATGAEVVFGEVTDDVFFKNRNVKIQELAMAYGVHYVPDLMKDVFWTISKKFDPLHPDDRGYELMTERMLPVVQQVLAGLEMTGE